MPLGVLLVASWEPLGVFLGAMMDLWGPQIENYDFHWFHNGLEATKPGAAAKILALLGSLGSLMGASWGSLRGLLANLECSWASLATSWVTEWLF